MFLLTQVRSSLLKVCSIKPEVNKSDLKNLLWAGSRFDKITVMLYHLRRAKRDPEKMKQLVAKTSSTSFAEVKALLDGLQLEADEKPKGEALPVTAKEEDLQSPPAKPNTGKSASVEKSTPPKVSSKQKQKTGSGHKAPKEAVKKDSTGKANVHHTK